jgi:ribonuclease P protein component
MDSWCAVVRAAGARCCAGAARAVAGASGCSVAAGKLFGLDGARRLRGSAEFERLLREGLRRRIGGYTFYTTKRNGVPARLGILISRREARSAVERNRIKRRIREAFRLEQQALAGVELLVRPPAGLRADAAMVRALRKLLAGLNA